ncbi:hypothetical protein [Psychrobacter sp. M13]|uniref:hypothetical protein n=1 Tax=Psychrobacter sp. M13 TaxID=3067275 RepID=UPI00273B0CBB|nr:hypothetical protein [Psychrobacter sp. M13]WLP95493.1 hypothetical protein Q9G97_05170 [Psychrobacter sp. M13]
MKSYLSFKKVVLLSASMLIGMSAANAHTTNLSTSIIDNCDNVTKFARNLDHNNAQISDAQMKSYIDARVACQVQHQDQHLQSEKYFINKYGSQSNRSSDAILKEYVQH